MMAEPSYSYRHHVLSPERIYRLSPDGLAWNDNRHEGRIAYGDVEQVHIFRRRILGSPTAYWSCELIPRSGGKIKLGAANRVGFRAIEDRTATYIPFIQDLEARITAANPKLRVVTDRHWRDRIAAVVGQLGVWTFRALRRLNFKHAPDVTAWAMRRIGPLLRGHRTARSQLVAVFPEKSAAEIETILIGMWDNLGRIGAEYLNFERLADYDPAQPERSPIFMDPATAERMQRLRKPTLFFTAHIGNWELTATTITALGNELAVVYKPPKIGPIADELVKIRATGITATIAAGRDTPMQIRQALKRSWMVGMLVDQYFASGVDIMFFNRRSKFNPWFARFARLFDCAVYGTRIIRQPDGRLRFEITEPIETPRDAEGRIDVEGTMQAIVSTIEGWIREHPEQWLWLHRHWR